MIYTEGFGAELVRAEPVFLACRFHGQSHALKGVGH